MDYLIAVFSGFFLACLAPVLHRWCRSATGWLLVLYPLSLTGYLVGVAFDNAGRGLPRLEIPWVPSLNVQLAFFADGWSLLFGTIILLVGALVLVYAGGYLKGHPQLGRLYGFLLFFMASMLGLVFADDVLTLFVFWEATSIASYFLIGFDHEKPAARAAALKALLVTGAGGLALLAGLIVLAEAGGSYSISALRLRGDAVRAHGAYLPILILILLGAGTKSAQFPFHFWLPGAMEAPAPVSAYLHSATMVKAGVFLLARFHPILGGTPIWEIAVGGTGAITMLGGALLAVRETDAKLILAYSTVSALGILVLLLGLGTPLALAAMVLFLVGHAAYKGGLFLIAGILDHETGTRDTTILSGLARVMPATTAAGILAAASMAGIAPLFGFIAKEAFFNAMLEGSFAPWGILAAVAASLCFVVIAFVVGIRPFVGEERTFPVRPHDPPPTMWLGPLLLGFLGLALGLVPSPIADPLLVPAVAAVQGPGSAPTLDLSLWHGWNPALGWSLAALAGGIAACRWRGSIRAGLSKFDVLMQRGPARWYDAALAALDWTARTQTRLLQSGYLRYYLLIVLLTTLACVGSVLVPRLDVSWGFDWSDLRFYDVGLAVLIVLGMGMVVRFESRLAAIAGLGVVGYGVALLFVLFGAPDLAMTQFLVETLTLILFLLVFYHLPPGVRLSRWSDCVRDALVAIAVGAMMTTLVLLALQLDFYPPISSFFAAESVPQGHGRNIVNVILVDFRALDTLGEIVVLSIAAIGVYALLKLRPTPASVIPPENTAAKESAR